MQLKLSLKLFRKASNLSDKVLPKYMFKDDIQEFKNGKILGNLLCAYDLLENLFKLPKIDPII